MKPARSNIARTRPPIRAVSSALLFLACCGAPAPPAYPGELQPPERFLRDFLLRQEVLFRRGELEQGLQTALQHRGDTLTLVGLTPLGTRAFVLEQRGREVSFTSYLPDGEDGELPFPPEYVLHDIQRTLLPLLDGRALDDGVHRIQLGDEEIFERWANGRLLERRFRRTSEPTGELIITYGADGLVFGEAPGPIEIVNEWFDYRLTLRTLDYRDL